MDKLMPPQEIEFIKLQQKFYFSPLHFFALSENAIEELQATK